MTARQLAIVVIGRNEGERLRRCLLSAKTAQQDAVVVYVDSGSTDGSVPMAEGLGCKVLCLNMTTPFTAARARNEGFACALSSAPDLAYVQFVDGDCELAQDWIDAALMFLRAQPQVAAVCGRRRERYPQRSIYNQLCDLEWNTPVGKTRSCGGDVMLCTAAFRQVGGYRGSLIAGEEPELCVRLRSKGWIIWRLDKEMTLHDAAMTQFGQWWSRSKRAGHAFAEGAVLHGAFPERHNVRQTIRALLWGFGIPLMIALAAVWQPVLAIALLIYPVQVVRIALAGPIQGALAWWQAGFLMLAKFPEAQGVIMYWVNRMRNRTGTLIEYK